MKNSQFQKLCKVSNGSSSRAPAAPLPTTTCTHGFPQLLDVMIHICIHIRTRTRYAPGLPSDRRELVDGGGLDGGIHDAG